MLRAKSDIFQSTPIQIKALRKALIWTTADLGNFLGLYVIPKSRRCLTVENWEQGKHRPIVVFQHKMNQLAEAFPFYYLQELRELLTHRLSDAASRKICAKHSI